MDSGKLLLANHVELRDGSFWCLPGGGINPGEAPAEAALRELREECCVIGEVVRHISTVAYADGSSHHTFECKVIDGVLATGGDPEFADPNTILKGVAFMSLENLTLKDLFYLCQSGVMAIPDIESQIRELSSRPIR